MNHPLTANLTVPHADRVTITKSTVMDEHLRVIGYTTTIRAIGTGGQDITLTLNSDQPLEIRQ